MHCEEGKSAATKIISLRLSSVKKSGLVCAVIVRIVRLSFSLLNLRELEQRKKGGEERGEGSATVAEGEFGVDVELGHGLVLFGEIEERVVAEAVSAARGGEDFSFDGAVAGGENFSVAGCGEDAVVAGGWISVGSFVEGLFSEGLFSEGLEEAEVVALVDRRSGWAGEVLVFGVTG